MKAFLLAAGNGTRLRPFTDSTPKCLLPVRGVPLLRIWLENCRAAGITEVLVNAHAHADKVREFAATQDAGVAVHLVEERELLGSAGTLVENRSFVAGEEAFFVLYGDVLTDTDLRALMAFHLERNGLATLGLHRTEHPAQCGIATLDDQDTVLEFVEKPASPQSPWAFSGLMVAGPEILERVPAARPADLGFHLLPRLAGRMSAYRIPGYLLDIGTPQNYAAAQTSWPGLFQGRQPREDQREERECCKG